jgi:hypothetical protein
MKEKFQELVLTKWKPQNIQNEAGTRITIPYRPGKSLHPKVLREILNSVDITLEDFKN